MKLFSKAIIVLSLASVFCVSGCKKSSEPAKSTEEVVQSIKAWNKSDVNSLLAYIPADTPTVLVTTREVDSSHPAFSTLMKKSLKYYDDSMKSFERQLSHYSDETGKKVYDSLKSLRPLIENYEANAAEWGLDPKWHTDAAFYSSNDTFVVKITVADSQKVKAKLDSYIAEWTRAAKQDTDSPITFTELKAGSSTWYVYVATAELKDINDSKASLPSMIAYNLDNNILTLTSVKPGDTATLEKMLKIQDKPLTKDALGKIEKNAQAVGFVDTIKFTNQLLNSDTTKDLVKESADFELTPVCVKDINSIVAQFPKIRFVAKIEPTGEIISETVVQMSDKEELAKIKALTIDHLTVGGENSMAAVSLNLKLSDAIQYLQDTTKRISEHKYECESMNPLIPDFWTMTILGLSNPKVKMITSAFTGANVAIDKLNMAGNNIEVEAVANLTGPKLASDYPMLAGMAALSDPKLGQLLIMKKGEIKNIDLAEVVEQPLKVNALLTDTDIVVGTETYDVKAISSGKRTNDGTILSLSINTAIVNSLGLPLDDISIPDSTVGLSIGVNDEGFIFKTSSK